MSNKKPQAIVIGLALFSMFFGSGNLIFPLMLGRDAGSSFLISSFGFILSAVLIPCLGVIAISFAEGDYYKIFGTLFKSRVQNALIFIVLLSFIPFGAGPRCVVLAHASLKNFVWVPPLWLFAALFLGIVAYLVYDRRHLVDTLSKVLTPLLLVSILIMVASAFIYGEMDPPLKPAMELFTESLFEGYNTQDLLSSLFFSSSLIMLVKDSFNNKKEMITTLLKGSSIGIVLLGALYFFLIAASSLHSDILEGHSGIDLVSILAKHTLGPRWGFVAGIAVVLACLTTALALILAFSEFLADKILAKKHSYMAVPLSLLSVYMTSLLHFEGIMAIISPMMKIIYPFILVIVLKYLWELKKERA